MLWVHSRRVGYRFCGLWGTRRSCTQPRSCTIAYTLLCMMSNDVFPRPGTRGRPQNPLKEPHPALVDAQGITPKQKGRRQALLDRGRCGAPPLEERGVQRRTRVRERLPRTLRPSLAPLGRKGSSGWKDRAQRRRRVVGFQACDHCVRPPLSLRVPRPVHAQCATGLMRPQWAQRTPGMAAGLTAHVWTVRELLTIKCEPLHFQSNSG